MDHTLDIGDLRGRKVIDNRGATVGEITDLSIDPNAWRVRGVIVEVDRQVADDIHIDKPLFTGRPKLEIATDRIAAMGDNVILNVTTDDIATLLRERR